MKSNTQLLADMYANQGGREQLLVAVYEDEFILYANVTDERARRISALFDPDRASYSRCWSPFGTARSEDGMTYCWTFGRNHARYPDGDWLGLVMSNVSAVLRDTCRDLLPADGTVMYIDNRQRDLNTLESFCDWLRRQKPAA